MEPDYGESVRFLRLLRPDGPWLLSAFHPDEKKKSRAKICRSEQETLDWLKGHSDYNLYYSVNPSRGEADKKAERSDISRLEYLHVDIDPKDGEKQDDARDRIMRLLDKFDRPPTCRVASGGGVNALWKLREPVEMGGDLETADDLAGYNRQLSALLGGDPCHNVDRVLRLPGTVNWPNENKKRKKRAVALATMAEWNGREYGLEEFVKAERNQKTEKGFGDRGKVKAPGNVKRLGSVDDLDGSCGEGKTVPNWLKALIVQGNRDPADPKGRFASRSEALLAACCEMVRLGFENDVIYSVITDPDFKISESVLDKGSGIERYAVRQIERAKDFAVDPRLMELNDRYAVIKNYGGKCLVVEEVSSVPGLPPRLVSQAFGEFDKAHWNRVVQVGTDKAGGPVYERLGAWWLKHPERRQYERVTFSPGEDVKGAYNVWKGMDCESKPGDCGLYLAHVRDVVCSGVEEHYQYLVKWMARCVQKPGEPGQVAIVLKGKQGTGKGVFAENFGKLFGRHYAHVSNPAHLTGTFNQHFRGCVVLFGDEVFYAKDKKHLSILKTLITEPTLMYEAKYKDAESDVNCVHLILASNDEHVVNAAVDERRYFALEVSDARAQDTEYFGRIAEQMKAGGREALLNFLQEVDLSNFNVRKVPATKAMGDQKGESVTDRGQAWWLRALQTGVLRSTDGKCRYEPVEGAGGAWRVKASQLLREIEGRDEGSVNALKLGKFQAKLGIKRGGHANAEIWIPALAECRKAWKDTRFDTDFEDEVTEWKPEHDPGL